ncbi:type II CAAX prenyl endopeptidase Rce1 family protein [Edaphobacter sp.]|uniref:CPBP family glutamic-type intramembrane protease n=1 Tax=Edaphobacter sp. TaxID=1934404 RepID=UPI002DBA7E8A|nr:CPBP family glutamic-type intramembrane protease [Edaphobacter sp.]HEU5341006.1 CPBP family glutamic-type intramembrane protease [Edaphobacter sp.]
MAADTATPADPSPLSRAAKWRALVELGGGYGLILLVLWAPRTARHPLSITAIIWIVIATCVSFDGMRTMGLRVSRPLRSAWIVPATLALAACAIGVASVLGTLSLPRTCILFVQRYWGYAIWAAVQQFLLQDFFLLRLLRVLSAKHAAIAAALLFTLAHLPNPILTPLTLAWGLASCLLFLCYRNLYPLAIAHAILGITLAMTVPGHIDHNMRVGLGYLTYHQHHHLSQNPHTTSTSACVIAEAPTLRSSLHARP